MLAQMLYDRTLAARSPLAQRVTSRVHKSVTKRVDPTISIDVEGIHLHAPLSHRLPFYRRVHPRWDRNIGVLAALVSEQNPDATMIDIGANVGDTTAMARTAARRLPILCVEGNPRFAALLRANASVLGDVEIAAPVLLSDTDGSVRGSFREWGGTAAFDADEAGPHVESVTLDRLLATHPRFSTPALLKSDTDGYEAKILAGARQTLLHARPVLLLEYEPEMLDATGIDGLSMLRALLQLDYRPLLVYDSTGVPLFMTSLDAERLLADLDRYAREKSTYLEMAVFPRGAESLAEELHGRETALAP